MGECLKYHLPCKEYGELKHCRNRELKCKSILSENYIMKKNRDVQSLIAVDRFSKWPTAKIYWTSETKEVISLFANNFNKLGIPEKNK